MIRPLLGSLLLLIPQLAQGATATADDSLLVPTLKMIGALGVVVGLLLLFYAASRKGFGVLPRNRDGQIRMLETKPLGGKKFLCLVKVRDQELLLGVSNERIEYLSRMETRTDFAKTLENEVETTEKPATGEDEG